MKQVFVQKIVDGKPKGRKQKLQIGQDEIVFDLLVKSSRILNFSDESRLTVRCDDQVLDETQSLNDVDEYSTFLVSEEQEEENTETNGGKLTRTLFLQQGDMEKKIDMPLEARIYDVKEIARQLFTMNQEYCVNITDDKKEILPSGKKIIDIPDFSTLTLLEKGSQEETQLDENVILPEDNSQPRRQWTEKEAEEILVLKQKVLDFYNGKGLLPNGISIEIVDYEDNDNNGTRYERQEANGIRSGEKDPSTSTSEEDSDSTSGSMTSCSDSDDEGFEVIPEENQNQDGVQAAEYETWTCYHHFKKFHIKFVLDEDILKAVRKILTEESSIGRYEALDTTIKTMKRFNDVPIYLQNMSFHCGGNFTFETEIEHGFERGDLSEGSPNIFVNSDLNDKLVMFKAKGIEDWSITPDLTDTSNKPTKIDFMEMLTKCQDNDKALLDAVEFLSQYKKSHSHFIILASQFTLSNLFKEMETKPRIPSTFLNPTENVVMSYLTLEDFPQLDIHEGSRPMFCFCVQINRRKRNEELLKDIQSYLDCIHNVPLNFICLTLFGGADESRTIELKKQVKDMFGISKSLEFCGGNISDLATGLLEVQELKEQSIEYRSYADFKTGKRVAPKIAAKNEELNILILGETGVGKSTWINAIANYLRFTSLDEAAVNKASEMISLIPSRFMYMDQNVKQEILIGNPDDNEKLVVGKSATQGPKEYRFKVENVTINLIDTPGIGDVDGMDADKRNFDSILSFLSNYEKLHAVCVLLKPNQSRLTVAFRFCVLELLTHLHKSLVQNIMFCFTHTRATFYNPGDTFDLLQELLHKNNIDIPLENGKSYFCFDNEAFRLLACLNNGIEIDRRKMVAYTESWTFASEMTHQMFDQIRSLPPHDTKKTVSMNEARNIVIKLSKPMAEILDVVEKTKEEGELTKALINSADNDIKEFERSLHFKGFSLETTPLNYPMTVCTHQNCVRHVQVGESRHQNTVYVTQCHDHCYVEGIQTEMTNNPHLSKCLAFDGMGNPCRRCGHDFKVHMHITYTTTIVETEFLSIQAQNNIKKKGSVKEKKQEFLRLLENKITDLEYERIIIMESAAKFAAFMKNTAMIPYNDSFNDYLDMLINDEQSKPDELRDRQKIAKMQENKKIYSQRVECLKVALSSSDTEVEIAAENIFEMKTQLMGLKHYGRNLQSMLDGIQIGRSVHVRRNRVTVRHRSGSPEDHKTWWIRTWVRVRRFFLN